MATKLSSDRNTLELLALLSAHKVANLVLCPGSRNAGIVHSALQIKNFKCHSIVDERSAGFFAIGLALASGTPSAVIVTSGSALANLYPAACEAFYQQVPVIFISADRPSEWIGQMDGQTMPQQGALGKMVKISVSLPPSPRDKQSQNDSIWHSNRLVNEAILECTHNCCGPVHINIPIHEPIYDFTVEHLPRVRKIERMLGMAGETVKKLAYRAESYKKTLMLVGQCSPEKLTDCNPAQLGLSIVGENLSNMNNRLYINSYTVDWNKMEPLDLVITIGGHLTDKRMKEWIRKNPPKEHWHVSENGQIADLFGCQTLAIEASIEDFLRKMPHIGNSVSIPVKYYSSSDLLDEFFSRIPADSIVHLANSSTIRLAQYSKLPVGLDGRNPTICCNRGINGIEGSLSTAVGFATQCSNKKNFVIIGDLSFFYDQNALWNTSLPDNLHILLINNGGGAIFNTLPIPDNARSRSYIQATHMTNAKAVAEEYCIRYLSGVDKIDEFITINETVILEICETGNK